MLDFPRSQAEPGNATQEALPPSKRQAVFIGFLAIS